MTSKPDPSEPEAVEAKRSLAELISAGDQDAIAGFRDAHVQKMRSYCREACRPDDVEEACEAATVDFVARVQGQPSTEPPLEDLLLKATRSAAAGRFQVSSPPTGEDAAVCASMPELLAAQANGELPGAAGELRAHLETCSTCAETVARMQRAEQAFAGAVGWEPVAEAVSEPEPEPERVPSPPPSPPPAVVRVRRGGLVGAARRLRDQLSGPRPPDQPPR